MQARIKPALALGPGEGKELEDDDSKDNPCSQTRLGFALSYLEHTVALYAWTQEKYLKPVDRPPSFQSRTIYFFLKGCAVLDFLAPFVFIHVYSVSRAISHLLTS